jgi:PKD domain
MIDRRHHILRSLLLAVAAAMTAGALGAASAGAVTFGGLGRVGESSVKAGKEGKPGQVNPGGKHNFAVDPETGDLFIVDEFAEGVKNFGRIQEFSPKGEFLAESRVQLTVTTAVELGGLAIDAAAKRVYLLVNETRPPEEEIFDPELKAADRLFSFSTESNASKELKEKKVTELNGLAEKGALLDPAGIAVDPTTHDVVILGQQDESTKPGSGEEELRAAVERVHSSGTVGARYVDQGNCLDGAAAPCEEKPAEAPRSPIVTPQGRVYVEDENEIWELPTPASEEKTIVIKPKLVFNLGGQQSLLTTAGKEEQAGSMSFTSLKAGEGDIYITTNIGAELGVSSQSGVLVLKWVENGPEAAEVTERGWTGGQSVLSGQHNCAIPVATVSPLIAAGSGEEALVFDATSALEGSLVELFAFGPSPAAEACGHVHVSPPVVEVGEEKNATKVETGVSTTITSTVVGANAKSTKWQLLFTGRNGERETDELSTGYQFEKPTLTHAFTRVGKYEIIETIETDNLGTPAVTVKAAQVLETFPLTVKIPAHAPVTAGEEVTLEAIVTDNKEASPRLKYTWSFGDGSAAVVEEEKAPSSKVAHKVKHTFATRCVPCIVTVEVEDVATRTSEKARAEVTVGESQAERVAREKAEQETHQREREAREAAERVQKAKEASEAAQRAAEVAQHEREAREKAEREHQEVLAFQARHNPEAKLATTPLSVKKSGAFMIKVSCPITEATACLGTVTLRSLTPVKVGRKKTTLTLATVSFNIAGDQTKSVTLHLSGQARSLLLRSHSLRARATVVAHDSASVTRTTTATVTLRLAKH